MPYALCTSEHVTEKGYMFFPVYFAYCTALFSKKLSKFSCLN
jgi:hypothetical protein